MLVLDYRTANALGIDRRASPQIVAEYLARQAGTPTIDTLPPSAAEWLERVATVLADHLPHIEDTRWTAAASEPLDTEAIARSAVDTLLRTLRRADSPAVLGVIAPQLIVGGCPARDLPKVCRAHVGRHLETFCRRVLDEWADQGYLRNNTA